MLALSMDESEDRMHSGLQNVIATGRVWKSKREMRNASLYHTSKFIGYQLLIFYKFQRSSLQRAPFVEGAGSKKTRAPWPYVISCGRGPTLECLRTHAWEINQPHGLPQPSIAGYALQLLLAAKVNERHMNRGCGSSNFHTLDSYAFHLPWRENK